MGSTRTWFVVASLLVAQALRVTIYRPRWAMAWLAAYATVRVGSAATLPVLVSRVVLPV